MTGCIKRVAALTAVPPCAAPAAFADQPQPGPATPRSTTRRLTTELSRRARHTRTGCQALSRSTAEHGKSARPSSATSQGVYAGAGKVDVKSGNAHVRQGRMVDTTVTFNLNR